jgi:hypothetical protein
VEAFVICIKWIQEADRSKFVCTNEQYYLLIDPATPPSTKARAADSVLDHSAKAIELEDIEARVSELERAAEASKQHC